MEDKSNLDVNGQTLRRTAYGYSRDFNTNTALNAGFVHVAEGQLDDFLTQYGWCSLIFRKKISP